MISAWGRSWKALGRGNPENVEQAATAIYNEWYQSDNKDAFANEVQKALDDGLDDIAEMIQHLTIQDEERIEHHLDSLYNGIRLTSKTDFGNRLETKVTTLRRSAEPQKAEPQKAGPLKAEPQQEPPHSVGRGGAAEGGEGAAEVGAEVGAEAATSAVPVVGRWSQSVQPCLE
jgi:hypothetical protein